MPQAAENDVTGKLSLITGASGGIGRAIAKDLYRQGISLALTYLNNEDSIETLVTELDEYAASVGTKGVEQPRISIHQADIESAEDLERIFSEIKEYHGQAGPDILVSAAGYRPEHQNIADIDIPEFERTIDINLRSNFILCKLAIPHMQAQHWGRVVFISSISGRGGGVQGAHFAASKAGLTGMMRNLAAKHVGDGITVNDVAPAMIGDTGMVPDEKLVEAMEEEREAMAPVGRLGTPQECAEVVGMFIRTGYMTGQSVLLSGGLK